MLQIFQRDMPLNEADPNNLLMHVNRHLERIAGLSSLTIDDFKQAIMSDPVLFNALKGVSGDTIQNYGGSLLKNGALEFGTLDGWSKLENCELLEEKHNGLKILKINSAYPKSDFVLINPNLLYKIECYYKKQSGNSFNIYLSCHDINKDFCFKSTNPDNYWSTLSSSCNDVFSKKTLFFGGKGTGATNLADSCSYIRIYPESLGVGYINSLTISPVNIGEPVPFNLPYLPVGQMVYDPTDGIVGRYDGTTIHWFTIAV